MNSVYAKIGTNGGPNNDGVVSVDVLRLDLWRESQAGLGRFRILLLNTGDKYGDKFLPQ